ncbi:MAG: hypothetical protein M0P01_01190 [Treponema sp.]|nr:hypothetical protein [Treponema sp.]
MRKILRYVIYTAIDTIILLHPINAETTRSVDFLGIVSTDLDSSMVKMTEDLYYTQMGEISGFTVIDKRTEGFSTKYISDGKPDLSVTTSPFVFYVIIKKSSQNTEKWICIFTITDKNRGNSYSDSKEYDSYYKILMESKSVLQSFFAHYVTSLNTTEVPESNKNTIDISSIDSDMSSASISTDMLAGTWSGEEFIDKIVILRGGRGFIIFNNGATMNISVDIDKTLKKVIITETGKANASFFPDLPRKTALEAATTALPIQWNLMLKDVNTLTGTKSTLVQNGDASQTGTVAVVWTRK